MKFQEKKENCRRRIKIEVLGSLSLSLTFIRSYWVTIGVEDLPLEKSKFCCWIKVLLLGQSSVVGEIEILLLQDQSTRSKLLLEGYHLQKK